MKQPIHALVLVVLMLFTGCASTQSTNSASTRREVQQIRRQLAEWPPLKEAGATVRDVRFSSDHKKVLVLLDVPAGSQANPEIYLESDGFGRYTGVFSAAGSQFGRTRITIDLGKSE